MRLPVKKLSLPFSISSPIFLSVTVVLLTGRPKFSAPKLCHFVWNFLHGRVNRKSVKTADLLRHKHRHCMWYAFFWVIPRRLMFICRRFGTLFHLHRQCDVSRMNSHHTAYEDGTDRVFRNVGMRRGITQKKAYNIQNTAKAWNQG